MTKINQNRNAPLEIEPDEFRELGHLLVDRIAEFLESLPERKVTTGESPSQIRELLGGGSLPRDGTDPKRLLDEAATLLLDHSLFNGHPRFWGYITPSAAPIGALGDLLASAINQNVGAWALSPVATEMELQTIRWIAEMIGYSTECGGVLVSGGNMANFVCFLAARCNKASWNIREQGFFSDETRKLRAYASKSTHTWIMKAADMFGLGTDAIRWIDTDENLRLDPRKLRQIIEKDISNGDQPFLVIGTAGSVSTGVVDPLKELSKVCKYYDLWFHVDGAYGAFAAVSSEAPSELFDLSLADSIAIDPHKWLYAPLEAGCALVRDPGLLQNTFSYHPEYYKFEEVRGEKTTSLVDRGPQNSRGFRALKVWLGLRQIGRQGYEQMISDDIRLSEYLFQLMESHPEFQALTHHLSITTFRYVPSNMVMDDPESEAYLNQLNTEILTQLQEGGEAFVSNAVINGMYLLRACIVNFRTSQEDIDALPEIIARIGRELHSEMRPSG